MRVLIVEDEAYLAEAVAELLATLPAECEIAADGQRAIDLLCERNFDVVVLDRDLPIVHGDDVCRFLVADEVRPRVLMLTAATELDSVVGGFELGADDYLAKPFAGRELIARVRALVRRAHTEQVRYCVGSITLDISRHEVLRNECTILLTPKEFAVLRELCRADGAVVSPERLLAEAWDENANPFTNSIKVTLSKLRRKLGDPPELITVRGAGYALRPEGA